MSIECYEGGAGTGKTHSLIVALERRLTTTPLEDGQSVLAITFMHGSRHRLASRLRALRAARGRHECMTIDSLAWHLVCRWRGLLAAIGTDVRNLPGWSFDQRCEGAASLLANGSVRRWLCRRFPIVIVDELQDVRGSRLAIVKSLAADAHLIAAADGFQDLGALGDSESVAWLRDAATPTVLTQSHRTACADLLASAAAIRAGQVIADRPLCKLISAPNPNAAAGIAACNLTWFGIAGTVVLTPTGPSSSQFVRAVVGRLQEKAIKPKALKGTAVGPFHIDWEARVSDDAEALIQSIGFEPGQADVDARSIRVTLDVRGGRQLQEAAEANAFVTALEPELKGKFNIGWGNRLERQITRYAPVIVAAGGTVGEAIDHVVATKLLRKLRNRHDVRVKELQELRTALRSRWKDRKLDPAPTQCEELLSSLIRTRSFEEGEAAS